MELSSEELRCGWCNEVLSPEELAACQRELSQWEAHRGTGDTWAEFETFVPTCGECSTGMAENSLALAAGDSRELQRRRFVVKWGCLVLIVATPILYYFAYLISRRRLGG